MLARVVLIALLASPVELSVTPKVAMAPTTVHVAVRVEPQKENRKLIVELENVALSIIDLDDDSPVTHQFTYLVVEDGSYEIRACVARIHAGEVTEVCATPQTVQIGPTPEAP